MTLAQFLALDFRILIANLVALIAVVSTAILFVVIWRNRTDRILTGFIMDNFASIIGLPFAAIASFVVVALFQQGEGPMEFSGLGFTFKGASGQVALWALCFFTVTFSIYLLWKPVTSSRRRARSARAGSRRRRAR